MNPNNPFHPRNSSVPLPGGGDTHIHPFGNQINDFTITTQIPIGPVGLPDGSTVPGSVSIHDNPLDPLNPSTNNITWR